MSAKDGIFSVKLYELEKQYGKTVSRLRLYQQQDHEEIRQEMRQLWIEYQENELLMRQSIQSSRSQAVAALAEAQLDYNQRVQHILRDELPHYLHGEGTDSAADRAEAASLYGEYAIDFAAQAMRHAMLSALSAIDLQMTCEEQASQNAKRINERGKK